MIRWPILLWAGFAALPVGCVILPESGDALNRPASAPKPAAFTATDLSPPQAAKACQAAAQELEKKGHDYEAVLEYQRARELDPHLPGVARQLAALYDRKNEIEHARLEYQAALREQPNDAKLLNDVGYFHYEQGQSVEAEHYLRQAVAIDGTLQRAWVNLGKVLEREGRYEESCEAFGHVVRPAQAAANVGVLLANEGKVTEARQVLYKALDLEPNLKAARIVLTQLESTTLPEVCLTNR